MVRKRNTTEINSIEQSSIEMFLFIYKKYKQNETTFARLK